MGQKVNPHGLRVGIIKDWDSRWYAEDQAFGDSLVEDYNIRKVLKKQLYGAGVAKIEIEKKANTIRISIHTAKPGIIIGKKGAMLKKIGELARKDIEEFMGTKVYLQTWVRVKENWRDSQFLISNFGYDARQ